MLQRRGIVSHPTILKGALSHQSESMISFFFCAHHLLQYLSRSRHNKLPSLCLNYTVEAVILGALVTVVLRGVHSTSYSLLFVVSAIASGGVNKCELIDDLPSVW